MISDEKKELGGWWVFILALVFVSLVVLTILGYMGKLTGTVVERKVFENSYQRSEGLKSQQFTWEAQLASINQQLLHTATDSDVYNQLMAQKAMLEVQIMQTKGMK